MNEEIAEENLKSVSLVLEKHKIKYFLNHGALLGVCRNGKFIKDDRDVDIGILGEDWTKFSSECIPVIKRIGFTIEDKCEGNKLSFMVVRKEEVVDFDGYHLVVGGYRKFQSFRVPAHLFDGFREIKFYGKSYPIFIKAEEYLETVYDKNWRIPNKTQHARL